ncbi:MAG: hypothetical protein BHV78_00120 [Bacteroides sp. CAG:1060_57_27]|nr:MAG: hypothetical protein BHV78_00120 [Bacteroides sp. CAG:1060_57_27]
MYRAALKAFGFRAFDTATNIVAPRQCKPNKFICIALGFFLYSAPPHMLVRLGITNKFVLLSASAYIC